MFMNVQNNLEHCINNSQAPAFQLEPSDNMQNGILRRGILEKNEHLE